MDGDRFDRFSQAVGQETTRRGVLRVAAGGALGLLGLGRLGEEAFAKKGFDGSRCKKNKGKCRYIDGCGDKGDFCKNNDDCCGSRKCRNQRCRGNKN